MKHRLGLDVGKSGVRIRDCYNDWNFLKSDLLIFDLLKEKKEEKNVIIFLILLFIFISCDAALIPVGNMRA